jgi:hypothetical protein
LRSRQTERDERGKRDSATARLKIGWTKPRANDGPMGIESLVRGGENAQLKAIAGARAPCVWVRADPSQGVELRCSGRRSVRAENLPTASKVVASFVPWTRLRCWLGGNKRREGGTDCELAISWSSVGRCPTGGGKDSNCHHMPSVADRTIAQRPSGQFFVKIAVVGLGLRRDEAG